MATEIIRFDDLDYRQEPPVRTPATETVTFSFGDSGTLALDLSSEHAKEISEMLAPWIAAATPVKATRATRTTNGGSTDGRTPEYLKAFRAWAAEQGKPVFQYTRSNGKPGAYRYDADQMSQYDAHLAKQAASK